MPFHSLSTYVILFSGFTSSCSAISNPMGDWQKAKDFINDGTSGAALNGEKLSDTQFRVPDMGLTGNFDHSIMMKVTLPPTDPLAREWLLNFGQKGSKAHHWIYNPKNALPNHGRIQFGQWNGNQVKKKIPNNVNYVTIVSTYKFDTRDYIVYVDGKIHGSTKTKIDLTTSEFLVGQGNYGNELDFTGIVHRVQFWNEALSVADVSLISSLPVGKWKPETDFKNHGTCGAACDGEKLSLTQFSVSDMGLIGKFDHSIMMKVTFPETDPAAREWLLNFGQKGSKAHHWLYNPKNALPNHGRIQFGEWNGNQVKKNIPNNVNDVTIVSTYNSNTGKYKVYVNGKLHGSTKAEIDLITSKFVVGQGTYGNERNFTGIVHRVTLWDRTLSAEEVLNLSHKSCSGRRYLRQ